MNGRKKERKKERRKKTDRQTDRQKDRKKERQTDRKKERKTGENTRKEEGKELLLVAYRPSNMLVYLRGGSAQTVVRSATLSFKLHIKHCMPTSHGILTPVQPVPALIL